MHRGEREFWRNTGILSSDQRHRHRSPELHRLPADHSGTFGTMNSGDFTAKGQKPDNGRTRTISIPIKCTSATAEANLKLTLQAAQPVISGCYFDHQ